MPVQRYDIRRPEAEGGGFEERFWSPTNAPVLGPGGELRYIIHRVEDVSDYVRLQRADEAPQRAVFAQGREVAEASRKLKDANAELAELYKRTKELDDLKSQFFANVSHELRTPLTLILAPVEKLLDVRPTRDPVRRDLEVVARNAQVLLRHVNNLLDASKLEAGGIAAMATLDDTVREIRATVYDIETRPARRPLRAEYQQILEQGESGDA